MNATVCLTPADVLSRVAHDELVAAFGSQYNQLYALASTAEPDDTMRMNWRFEVSTESVRRITATICNVLEALDKTDATLTGSADMEEGIAALLELGLALDTFVKRIRESEAEALDAEIAELELQLETE